ncbi:glycosyl hydrolase [Posidoniimonas polymericola]|uniref:glycosyl hydrolase n=1 Tax=Posidoniimonas polymericola TaxID=2528002 RepID=UPI0011B5B2AD|nr:glycosyl hydrolase [Posidoniimonas polymericola]
MLTLAGLLVALICPPAQAEIADLRRAFDTPAADAKPWVFWYWLDAAVSAEGITADLEAMQAAGIGGAYLMPIYGPQEPPLITPPATQLSPEWWELVRHAASEADRLELRLAMHLSDGFALAGGPWITPEQSMQQVVWSRASAVGGQAVELELPRPLAREGYYQEIAVLAFPTPQGEGVSTANVPVTVTTNAEGQQAQQLVVAGNSERLRSAEPCVIDFAFEAPFTCRSVTIRPDGGNYQCQRLRLEVSDDGHAYRVVSRLAPPRHGWQDEGRPVTHAVPEVTSRYFRLAFDPAGSEPGAEELDSAKWSPVLKVQGIELSGAARVHQYRGKSGAVWRISPPTRERYPASARVASASILDLSDQLGPDNMLRWDAPPGEWTVLRFGHTSTGKQNATGGGGRGLECDKLNPAAVRLQYQSWFGAAREKLGGPLADRVLTRLHVDSWECGSQNWTESLPEEFIKRGGYAARRWLPTLAGYIIDSPDASERFLYDFRRTLTDQLDDAFFGTLEQLASEAGVEFTAECTAPTMLGDGLRHFQHVDIPMGEFWRDSPTHDKPTDIRDAISAGHIYGKRVIGAEAFTQLRIRWDETPALLKPQADRHFCLGVNQLVYHVWMHNPWLDRQPGVTLNGIGAYLQRDQAWQPMAPAWIGYCRRLQSVLRQGDPVVDIAVFTGEELPSRSVLPEQLASTLAGLFGAEQLAREQQRLANEGTPTREVPEGVRHSANISDPAAWSNPLQGYQYDSLNRDALLRLAAVQDGRIVLQGGASYALLVIPAPRPSAPGGMTVEVAEKLLEIAEAGGRVLLAEFPSRTLGRHEDSEYDVQVGRLVARLVRSPNVTVGAWREPHLASIGVAPDFQVSQPSGEPVTELAWTHRRGPGWDAYLIANQQDAPRELVFKPRVPIEHAEAWDPVTGRREPLPASGAGAPLRLSPWQSLLVVLTDEDETPPPIFGRPEINELDAIWRVGFDSIVGSPPATMTLTRLQDLTRLPNPAAQQFVGSARYTTSMVAQPQQAAGRAWIDLGEVAGMARVIVNGQACGVAWTPPYRVEVTDALRPGRNQLEVEVAGVWRNRMVADQQLPADQRLTWTNARPLPESAGPVPFGLLGPVRLETTKPQ